MDSSKAGYFYMALVTLLGLTIGYIDCVGDGHRQSSRYKSGRFQDIAQAISFMQTHLSDMSKEEKCKRYAVFSDIALEERLPIKNTALKIVEMDKADLDKQYKQMDACRLCWIYMSAIDRYRLTELAPPIIELAECLELIDHHGARKYLKNPELIIILGLYKRVLGMPTDTVIDLATLDFGKFHPTFRGMLRNQFIKYFDIDSIIGGASAEPRPEPQSEREQFRIRRRERSRLQMQRIKLLKADVIQRYNDNRRNRVRAQREKLSRPAETLEQAEAKRLDREKRDRRNERTRLRRRSRKQTTGRFDDIAQAINFIQAHLAAEISKEEKCRRYAVLADMSMNEKLTTKYSALTVAALDKYDLDEYYEQLDPSRLGGLYMCAIDRYRMTQLAPPMIELAECLQQIDSHAAREYLGDPELVIILNLYRRALGLPYDSEIDLALVDFGKIHPTFRETLKKLFSKYHDIDSIIGDASATWPIISQPQSRGELNRIRRREKARLAQRRSRLVRLQALKKFEDGHSKRLRKQRETLMQLAKTPAKLVAKRAQSKRENRVDIRNTRRELRQQKRSREQQRLRDELNSLDAYDDRLADELLELYNSFPYVQSQHMGQGYNNLLQGVASDTQSQRANLESPLISFEPNSQLESQLRQQLQDYAARFDKAGSVVEFLLDEPTTSETRVDGPEGAHDPQVMPPPVSLGQDRQALPSIDSPPATNPLGVYIARPISPHHILDTNITTNKDTIGGLLADDLVKLYDSFPGDTQLQHPGQEYHHLLHKVTSGLQSQGVSLQSPLISFEPNSQEESQFRHQLEDCADRFDRYGSVVEFLLDEPTASETRGDYPEGDQRLQLHAEQHPHEHARQAMPPPVSLGQAPQPFASIGSSPATDTLGAHIPRPFPPHHYLDTNITESNVTLQNLLADVPLGIYDPLPNDTAESQQLGSQHNSQLHRVRSYVAGDNVESSLISPEPNSQEVSIVDELLLDEPSSEIPSDDPGEPKRYY